MRWLTIDEIEDAHKKLDIRIRGGFEIDPREWAELFDHHSQLLMQYRQLEQAFLAFHGYSKDFTVDQKDRTTMIRAKPVK